MPRHRFVQYNWVRNTDPPAIEECWDLLDEDGQRVAFLVRRPPHCNRGHWMGNVECVTDLDRLDSWPNYYMSFERAKEEIVAFLRWRMDKIPCMDA